MNGNISFLGKRNFFGLLIAAILVFIVSRFFFVTFSLVSHTCESRLRACGFFVIAFVLLIGPGLFFWAKLKPKTDNPFIFPVFVTSASLGMSMLVLWLLYLFGIYNYYVSCTFLALMAFAGIYGLHRILKEKIPISSGFHISLLEFAAITLSLLFCEGIFECLAGTPISSWDAVISWDKWATDIASRSGLKGYICGAYPQGIPIINALFYKILLPAEMNPVLSTEHLLCNGFFQFFPFLLCMSLIAAAREYKLNPLLTLGITFGCSELVRAILKQSGYVDIPLAAAVAAILPLYSLLRKQIPESKWTLPAITCLLFPIAFIKGNGFAACVLSLPLFLFVRNKNHRSMFHALLIVISISSVFFLHQWITGSWTEFGETSPFNHSLVVVTSHSDLINISFAHFFDTLSKWAAFFGFSSVCLKYCWFVLLAVLIILPLTVKRTRLSGIFTAALLAVWFFTGSYDARNAYFILPLLSVLAPLSLSTVTASMPLAKISVTAVAILVVFFSLSHTRIFEIAKQPFSAYKTPKEISMTENARIRNYLKATDDEASFFTKSDVAKRASHIISASAVYRHLGNKGVYPMQKTGLNDIRPHDMAFSSYKIFSPKSPFVPVSTLRKGFSPGQAVFLASPELRPVDFSIVPDGDKTILRIRDRGIASNSGFISVTTDKPLPHDAGLVPLLIFSKAASSFLPYCRGNNLRIMFWTWTSTDRLDYSVLNFGDAKIVKVEIGY